MGLSATAKNALRISLGTAANEVISLLDRVSEEIANEKAQPSALAVVPAPTEPTVLAPGAT